ncbi:MAG TPA: L-serine ammonia-lyase, partial [Bryobacterales bacterium]|nr:L-serine ammonia-lyase [Bryobacterales bacterium]
MWTSVLELFSIGLGPSSSHAIGPMRAGRRFVRRLGAEGLLDRAARIRVTLYGSLAWTGKGHGTDRAILLGLAGYDPETVDPDEAARFFDGVLSTARLPLEHGPTVAWDPACDMVFDRKTLVGQHPNALDIRAEDGSGMGLLDARYYSIGGG